MNVPFLIHNHSIVCSIVVTHVTIRLRSFQKNRSKQTKHKYITIFRGHIVGHLLGCFMLSARSLRAIRFLRAYIIHINKHAHTQNSSQQPAADRYGRAYATTIPNDVFGTEFQSCVCFLAHSLALCQFSAHSFIHSVHFRIFNSIFTIDHPIKHRNWI